MCDYIVTIYIINLSIYLSIQLSSNYHLLISSNYDIYISSFLFCVVRWHLLVTFKIAVKVNDQKKSQIFDNANQCGNKQSINRFQGYYDVKKIWVNSGLVQKSVLYIQFTMVSSLLRQNITNFTPCSLAMLKGFISAHRSLYIFVYYRFDYDIDDFYKNNTERLKGKYRIFCLHLYRFQSLRECETNS